MATMKAAVVTEFGKPLDIREVEKPEASLGKIVVKVEASGVCHTDLHAANGDWPVKPTPPFIPGHEGVGIVAEIGEGVTVVKEGDRVACHGCTPPAAAATTAAADGKRCAPDSKTQDIRSTEASPNMCWPTHNMSGTCLTVSISRPPAPVLCAGVTVYKGLKETDTRPGHTVAVMGIGGLGHMAVQYAKAMGLFVIAVDIADEKLALAKKLGADQVINAAETDPAAEAQKSGGVEGVLVTAVSTSSFSQGLGMLARGGTMSLVGLPPGTFELPIFDVVLSRKTIRGSIVGTRKDLAESLAFAAQGKVAAHFTTETLDDINSIFSRMAQGKIDGRIVMEV